MGVYLSVIRIYSQDSVVEVEKRVYKSPIARLERSAMGLTNLDGVCIRMPGVSGIVRSTVKDFRRFLTSSQKSSHSHHQRPVPETPSLPDQLPFFRS